MTRFLTSTAVLVSTVFLALTACNNEQQKTENKHLIWTDSLKNWSINFSYESPYRDSTDTLVLGYLYLKRNSAVKTDDHHSPEPWIPSGYCKAYDSKYIDKVKSGSKISAYLSSTVPPYVGGNYYTTDKYIFSNMGAVNNCFGVIGTDTIDFCKPFFDSITTLLNQNKNKTIQQFFDSVAINKIPAPTY